MDLVVDYFAIAGQWGEHVETSGTRRRYHGTAGTRCPAAQTSWSIRSDLKAQRIQSLLAGST